jgi:paraquat-inducible protein B
MSNKPNTRLIGAFVVGAVVLIVLIFLVFGSGKIFQQTDTWVVFFRGDVNGLRVGAPVKVKGVEIGSVTSIRGLFDENANILVEVIIETIQAAFDAVEEWAESEGELSDEELIEFYINKGFRAQLQSLSMVTGQLYVKWDYFPDTEAVLTGLNPDYTEIPSVPATTEELMGKLSASLTSLSEVPIGEIAKSLIYTMQGLDSLIRAPELIHMVSEFSETMQQTEILLKRIENRVDPLSGSLESTSEDAGRTLQRMEELLAELRNEIANDRYELRSALRQFAEANRSLRLLTQYLQENPRSIIFGKD